MEDGRDDVVKLIYIVKQNNNLTAYDTFNEDTFEGPTNVTDQEFGFLTEEEALTFYKKRQLMLKFAGSNGMYYTYPTTKDLTGRRTVAVEAKTEADVYYKILCPTEREICWLCDGDGTQVNPSVDGYGISPEHFNEDPDFAQSYMRGDYDIKCQQCNGERIISTPNLGKLPSNIMEDCLRAQRERNRDDAEEARRIRNLERGIHS